MITYYRPQRSWGKVIFSEVCVKNSVHRSGVVSQHALQVSRPTPRGEVEGSGLGGVSRPTPRGKLRGLAWRVSRPTPRGKLRGQAWGVSRPTPGESPGPHWGCLQAHTQGVPRHSPSGGGVSQHALRQTPLPSRWLLLWVVRILLECILVLIGFHSIVN